MLDKRRIKVMTELALYEEKQLEEDLKISSYYKKDYVALHNLYTFFWVTIGSFLLLGLLGVMGMGFLLSHISMTVLAILGLLILAGYVALLTICILVSSGIYTKKHTRARQGIKKYHQKLSRLLSLYEREIG